MIECTEKKKTIGSVLIKVISLWLGLFGITTIYNNYEFFDNLFSFPKITLVFIYMTLLLIPLIFSIIKKNFNESTNEAFQFFIWLFLFVDINIAVEATKTAHSYFGSVGYFKYLNFPKELEIVLLSMSLISVYILAAIKINYYIKNNIFLKLFTAIKALSILTFITNYSTAYKYCFYSFLIGIMEYFGIFLIIRRHKKKTEDIYKKAI